MKNQLIHDAFMRTVALFPKRIAVTCDDAAWTYAELEQKSREMAEALLRQGIARGNRVAILAERRAELIWTVLGALRAGAAFVIMDWSYPAKRLETFISTCRPQMIIPAGGDGVRALANGLAHETSVKMFEILTEVTDIDRPYEASEQPAISPDTDLAYMLFTSGSTGTPKGIACNHAALVHFIGWHTEQFGLVADDKFSMLSGLSHDPVLRDIFTPLSIGATLAIPRQCEITEPGRLRSWLEKNQVTVAHLTPPTGQLLLASGADAVTLPALRRMFWGGDQLSPRLLAAVSRFAPNAEHVNFYGSSETPQAVSFYRFRRDEGWTSVPIGGGVEGFKVLIIGPDRQPRFDREPGEIAIQSRFLSLGYVRDGVLIEPQDRGVDAATGEAVYYTGDQGRYLKDGNVLMMGRGDDQIKIRGFRVELSEVTSALQACPGVAMAVALPLRDGDRASIEAFVAHDGAIRLDQAAITARLALTLPTYMMPRKIWLFEGRLPTLPNGKFDRSALIEHARSAGFAEAEARHPATSAQAEALRRRWQEIFAGEEVRASSTFAELGGDSLSYVEAFLAAEEVVGELPVDWQERSIAELSAKGKTTSRWWTSVDSFMAIRAVAIALVVAYHFRLTKLGDGETGALFLVSGYLFGRMQLREIFSGGAAHRILTSIKNILLPTIGFTLLATIASFWQGHPPPPSLFMLGTDLVNYPALIARHVPVFRHVILFWYVHALIQNLFIIYLALQFAPARWKTARSLRPFTLALLGVGMVAKFGLPVLIQPGFLTQGAPELSLAQISPIGNFATFALGILVANAGSQGQKFSATITAFIFALLDGPTYGWLNAIPLFLAVLLILYVPRIKLPKAASGVVLALSGASLFIYLGHVYVGFFVGKLFHASATAKWSLALLGGVGMHRMWERRSLKGLFRRARQTRPEFGIEPDPFGGN